MLRICVFFGVAAQVHHGAAAPIPSSGCGRALPGDLTAGGSTFRDVQIIDPDARLGSHWRQYKASVPNSYHHSKPIPLLFYFHGQGGNDKLDDDKFVELANEERGDREPFLVISPQGMRDGAARYGDCAGTSSAWNVGSAGRLDVCTRECQPAIHVSCLHTANVSNCNWATCFDDFHFFDVVLEAVKKELCVDVSRIYGTGVSNGGMFLYALTAQLPQGTFAAIVPWYGAFLQNMRKDPPGGTAVLHLHGLLDKTIPAKGTYAEQYYYTTLQQTLEGWGKANGCDVAASFAAFATPFDDRATRMKHDCMKFKSCSSGAVVRCMFAHQAHGFWPAYGERMTLWFLWNHSASLESPAMTTDVQV